MSISLPAAINRTRQELAESQARTEALRLRLKALEEAASELAPSEEQRPQAPAGTETRTDAILAVMRSRPGVWTAAELSGLVAGRRHTVERSKDLAAALSYLRSISKVWSPRRGEWVLGGAPDPMEAVPPDNERLFDTDPNDVPF